MAEAKEKRPKIRCGEIEEGEVFKYKGGLFKVLRAFRDEVSPNRGSSRVLVLKPRRPVKNGMPLPKGDTTTFRHKVMVRRYEPPVTFQ